MRWLRILITYPLFAAIFPFLLLHPKMRAGQRQRFGLHPRVESRSSGGPRIWLHGASAGDILALQPTARSLRQLLPEATLMGTTVTNSGHAMLEFSTSLFDHIGYIPWDLPGPVRRTFAKLKPDLLVLEYAELWPELIHEAKRRGVKIVLQNGRFAGSRIEGYERLFRLTGNMLQSLDLLLMRDPAELDRALRLGAPPKNVRITGNTKLDQDKQHSPGLDKASIMTQLGLLEGEPVLVGGSTHEGEEEALLTVAKELLGESPYLKLIIAPRYIERAERIRHLALRLGLTASLRTGGPSRTQVVILDTIGELANIYSCATLVFIGGSLVDRGGHNIIEPAQYGCPVLFGPHMGNSDDSVQLLLGRGGIQVSNAKQLGKVITDLLSRDEDRRDLGRLAQLQVEQASGAAKRNAELIQGLLLEG